MSVGILWVVKYRAGSEATGSRSLHSFVLIRMVQNPTNKVFTASRDPRNVCIQLDPVAALPTLSLSTHKVLHLGKLL
jgi:hypothetical protein